MNLDAQYHGASPPENQPLKVEVKSRNDAPMTRSRLNGQIDEANAQIKNANPEGTGRGDIVHPLPLGRTLHFVLVSPPFGCPTAEVYRGLGSGHTSRDHRDAPHGDASPSPRSADEEELAGRVPVRPPRAQGASGRGARGTRTAPPASDRPTSASADRRPGRRHGY